MNATGTIMMTMRELDGFKVIQAVTEARLKPGQAGSNGSCIPLLDVTSLGHRSQSSDW